jgi:hypothetical protein
LTKRIPSDRPSVGILPSVRLTALSEPCPGPGPVSCTQASSLAASVCGAWVGSDWRETTQVSPGWLPLRRGRRLVVLVKLTVLGRSPARVQCHPQFRPIPVQQISCKTHRSRGDTCLLAARGVREGSQGRRLVQPINE